MTDPGQRRAVGTGAPGPITLELQDAYDAIVRGAAPARPGWIEPVYGTSSLAIGEDGPEQARIPTESVRS